MIYIDSSVALAYLLSESRAPSRSFLESALVSSRLLEYEAWTRLHANGVDRATVAYASADFRLIAYGYGSLPAFRWRADRGCELR